LVYGLDGRVDETQAYNADWIGLSGEALFAPLNVLELSLSRWAGHNPYVTEENVKALDLANGGSYSRFASRPPEFRAVVAYGGMRGPFAPGRSPLFAGRSLFPDPPTPRRGGLFRFFGGR